MKTKFLTIKSLLIICICSIVFYYQVFAHGDYVYKKNIWPFDGLFGYVDKQAAQRGYQVYKEVCASCHSLNRMRFNNLLNIGFSELEAKVLASNYTIIAEPNDKGELLERQRLLKDNFPSPYKNENEARYMNNGALPPDLSLIIKGRHDGANYVYSLLTGYSQKPDNLQLHDGLYYNEYFAGKQIGMPPPLVANIVTYQDGTIAEIDQMARDVVIFLQYVSEPEMQARKSMGLKVMLFLVFFTAIFYVANKRIWRDIK